jgi:RNA polymerase sigma factor (sigma-70 family)
MPTRINEVVRQLRQAAFQPDEAGLTDGQLLSRFIEHRDEVAVAALVQRHGPMVWGVCRRIVGKHHDAEDAFQATFLVLVRKAGSVRQREMIGHWLYGVAHQTAMKARATTAKRRTRERQVAAMPDASAPEQNAWRDVQPVLDLELSRLPGKYRVAIVLCDLEGKTRKESARQLGLPEGTLAGRLTRGRALLAKRLARRGLAVSGATWTAVLAPQASGCVPTSVLSSTIRAVTQVAAGQAASAEVISATVAALADGVLRTMLLNKIMKVAAVLFVLVAGLLGAGLLSYGTAAEKPDEVAEGQLQDVLVRHPKQMEAIPMEQFTGRLGVRQDDSIVLTFAVDERSYLQYQRQLQKQQVKGPGSPLHVALLDEDEFSRQGTLKGFDDRINPESGTVQAHASLPNPDRLLLPGMFVRVRIPFGPPQKVLGVPDEAVVADQGKHYVLVVTAEDIVERKAVTLGAAEGNTRIIKKGVGTDDWIVVGLVGGLNNLKPGVHVKRRIVEDAPKKEKGAGKDKPQQDEQGKHGTKDNRRGDADPDEGAGDRVAKKLWAGMSVNQPLFRVGQTANLIQFSFVLVNETDKAIDPKIPGYPRLIVNGKELDLSSIPVVGPRDERFKALPPGEDLQFGMGAGQFFDKPGVYRVYWQGEEFRSNEVVFRVMK